MPGECATIASGCTFSTSPPASWQRAIAKAGLWRIVISIGSSWRRTAEIVARVRPPPSAAARSRA